VTTCQGKTVYLCKPNHHHVTGTAINCGLTTFGPTAYGTASWRTMGQSNAGRSLAHPKREITEKKKWAQAQRWAGGRVPHRSMLVLPRGIWVPLSLPTPSFMASTDEE